ncbi:uncharacterized protein LOC143034956 [Oratosquilla oratoria]|uniref:uncharacterized protein LOC143034956 n=1 Tax=Oratosquilla oratoria TaxID=337810 RepID=UPI003F76CC72
MAARLSHTGNLDHTVVGRHQCFFKTQQHIAAIGSALRYRFQSRWFFGGLHELKAPRTQLARPLNQIVQAAEDKGVPRLQRMRGRLFVDSGTGFLEELKEAWCKKSEVENNVMISASGFPRNGSHPPPAPDGTPRRAAEMKGIEWESGGSQDNGFEVGKGRPSVPPDGRMQGVRGCWRRCRRRRCRLKSSRMKQKLTRCCQGNTDCLTACLPGWLLPEAAVPSQLLLLLLPRPPPPPPLLLLLQQPGSQTLPPAAAAVAAAMPTKGKRCCWSLEEECMLIDMYEAHPYLWNVKHEDYFKRGLRDKTLLQISEAINKPVEAIKQKFKILRDYFHDQLEKVELRRKTTGANASTAWQHMARLQFLRDANTPRSCRTHQQLLHEETVDAKASDENGSVDLSSSALQTKAQGIKRPAEEDQEGHEGKEEEDDVRASHAKSLRWDPAGGDVDAEFVVGKVELRDSYPPATTPSGSTSFPAGAASQSTSSSAASCEVEDELFARQVTAALQRMTPYSRDVFKVKVQQLILQHTHLETQDHNRNFHFLVDYFQKVFLWSTSSTFDEEGFRPAPSEVPRQ